MLKREVGKDLHDLDLSHWPVHNQESVRRLHQTKLALGPLLDEHPELAEVIHVGGSVAKFLAEENSEDIDVVVFPLEKKDRPLAERAFSLVEEILCCFNSLCEVRNGPNEGEFLISWSELDEWDGAERPASKPARFCITAQEKYDIPKRVVKR